MLDLALDGHVAGASDSDVTLQVAEQVRASPVEEVVLVEGIESCCVSRVLKFLVTSQQQCRIEKEMHAASALLFHGLK